MSRKFKQLEDREEKNYFQSSNLFYLYSDKMKVDKKWDFLKMIF